MLGSGRGILAAGAGLAAILIALSLGAYYGSLYGPDRKHYEAVSGQQPTNDDYRGPSESMRDISGLPGPVERAIANPQPRTGQDNEIRDLAAQEATAVWAFWMVVCSALSVIVTTVGTILLYRQIILTRQAVEDTGSATKAMLRQNEISEDAQRPWLFSDVKGWLANDRLQKVPSEGTVSPIRMFSDDDTRPRTAAVRYQISIINHGRTPALVTEVVLYVKGSRKAGQQYTMRGILKEGAAIPIPDQITGYINITPENRDEIMTDAPPVIGIVKYSDPLGVSREFGFAFRLTNLWSESIERYNDEQYHFDRRVTAKTA